MPPVATIGGRRTLFAMAVGQEYGPALAAHFTPLFTGVGPVEAAIAVARALAALAAAGETPDLVVSLGSSGSRRRPLGSVHQVSHVMWRDMDATRLGFPRHVVPFLDQPAVIPLPIPLADVPVATLATGATIVGGEEFDGIAADLVDMETYAVVRAGQVAGVPVIGWRGVSDGPGELAGMDDWTALLAYLDGRLADLCAALAALPPGPLALPRLACQAAG